MEGSDLHQALTFDPFHRVLASQSESGVQNSRHSIAGTGQYAPGTRDEAEFWNVWTVHRDRLFGLSVRLMAGNVADAEDALSVAMLNGCKAFSTLKVRNEAAWLSRLVHNACMDQYRRRSRQARMVDEPDISTVSSIEDIPTYGLQSPEERYIGQQEAASLVEQLKFLPDGLLKPLLMRCLGDMSYGEISDRLGLTNATVRKRVELARKRLRTMI